MKRILWFAAVAISGGVLASVVTAQGLQGSNVQVQNPNYHLQAAPAASPAIDTQPATCVSL